MNHNLLMIITANMPMRVISINNEPYLERYFISQDADGTQHWLHRFLRSDSERHLHSHPWTAESTILCGWYQEEYFSELLNRTLTCDYEAGYLNIITPDRLHRIIDVAPNTWTYMKVRPDRLPEWFFIDDEGNKVMMKTSPSDWHLNMGIREPLPFGKMQITESEPGLFDVDVSHLRAKKLSRDEATGLVASLIFKSPCVPPYLKPNKIEGVL